MAFGSTGRRVVVIGKVVWTREAEGQPGITEYLVHWQVSEPVADTLVNLPMTQNDESVFTSLEPTDSEIMSALRIGLVAGVNRELSPTDPFLETDIRGCSI